MLNHCYELLRDCVRRAEDVSPAMKVRASVGPRWGSEGCDDCKCGWLHTRAGWDVSRWGSAPGLPAARPAPQSPPALHPATLRHPPQGVYDALRGIKDGLRRLKAAGRCTAEDLAHFQVWVCGVQQAGQGAGGCTTPPAACSSAQRPISPASTHPLQGQLDRIDASRTDGVFCGNMEVSECVCVRARSVSCPAFKGPHPAVA